MKVILNFTVIISYPLNTLFQVLLVHDSVGLTVNHTYTAVGVYNVTVEAYNRVGRMGAWAIVHVQKVIQGELVSFYASNNS